MLGTSLQPQPIFSVGKVCARDNVSDVLDVLTERYFEICDDRHLVFSRSNALAAEFADSVLKPPEHNGVHLKVATEATNVEYGTSSISSRRTGRKLETVSVLKHLARAWQYVLIAIALVGLAYKVWAGSF